MLIAVLGRAFIATALVCISTASHAQQTIADGATGCHSSADECLLASFEWQDDVLVARYENQCADRIFIRYCHQREDTAADCAQAGIEPSGLLIARTDGNATGAARYRWVGSHSAESDLQCAEQAGDWNAPMFE